MGSLNPKPKCCGFGFEDRKEECALRIQAFAAELKPSRKSPDD